MFIFLAVKTMDENAVSTFYPASILMAEKFSSEKDALQRLEEELKIKSSYYKEDDEEDIDGFEIFQNGQTDNKTIKNVLFMDPDGEENIQYFVLNI